MNHQNREEVIFSVAQRLAPFYAQRWDNSRQEQYDSMAAESYAAAEALVKVHEAKLIAAVAKDEAAAAKMVKEAGNG